MKFIKHRLVREAIDSISQPIPEPVQTNKQSYLLEKGISKLGWRAIRRLFAFSVSGQKKYLVSHISSEKWKRCLWLYYDVPQIGDALLDLAPRSLLQEMGIKVDLYTHKHLAELFAEDSWLNLVGTDASSINTNDYDFVIVSSFKWRSLKHKFFHARKLPWISIFEKFSGPELNRAMYSTKRIAEIFHIKLNASELAFHSFQKLSFKQRSNEVTPLPNSVAITIGGVDSTRTYRNWHGVVSELKKVGIENVILIGNENGTAYIPHIIALQDVDFNIHNHVGKTTLKECRELMQSTSIIIATDGGLMHLAITCNKPVIGLFNQAINPAWRLPESLLTLSIQSNTRDINDILPLEIIKTVQKVKI